MRSTPPATDLLARLWAGPDDWSSWLAYADWLLEQGDARGQLISLEHQIVLQGIFTSESRVTQQKVDSLLEKHREEWSPSYADIDWDFGKGYLVFARDARLPWNSQTTDAFASIVAKPVARLFVADRPDEDIPHALENHYRCVIEAIIDRITSAFDGVPLPDEEHLTIYQAEAADGYAQCDRSRDHLGRWQDLPDEHIRINQWALSYLDAQGIRYYLPAIMCFELKSRMRLDYEPLWIFESLEYSLQPEKPSSDLHDYTRKRFALLDRSQRAAICTYALLLAGDKAFIPWSRVVEAERAGPRADWFELFSLERL